MIEMLKETLSEMNLHFRGKCNIIFLGGSTLTAKELSAAHI